jgi:hypothetical protein
VYGVGFVVPLLVITLGPTLWPVSGTLYSIGTPVRMLIGVATVVGAVTIV